MVASSFLLFLVSTESVPGAMEGDFVWLTCMVCTFGEEDGDWPIGAPGATASVLTGAEWKPGGAKAIGTAFT